MPENPKQFITGFSGVTYETIASFLKRTFTPDEQTEISSLITQIEYELAARCRRQFAYQTDDEQYPEAIEYSEFFDLPNDNFFPNAFPIEEVKSIKVEGVEKIETLTENVDYFIYDSHIEFYPDLFEVNQGRKALQLTYTIRKFWGDDVVLLIKKLAGKMWLASEDAGESIGERSFASVREVMDSKEFKNQVETTISRYKKKLV